MAKRNKYDQIDYQKTLPRSKQLAELPLGLHSQILENSLSASRHSVLASPGHCCASQPFSLPMNPRQIWTVPLPTKSNVY